MIQVLSMKHLIAINGLIYTCFGPKIELITKLNPEN